MRVSASVLLIALCCAGSARAAEITQQPQSVAARIGQAVTLSVVATGTEPVSYQWYRAGIAIPGGSAASLSIASLSEPDLGVYHCEVSDGAGIVRSRLARVSVASQLLGWTLGRTFGVSPSVSSPAVFSFVKGGSTAITVGGDLLPVTLSLPGSGVPSVVPGTVVPQTVPCVTAAAGTSGTVYLFADGSVVARNSSGALLPLPSGLANVHDVDVAPGGFCALRMDGSVIAWTAATGVPLVLPAAMTGIAQIAGTSNHVLALRGDGSVVAWAPYPGYDFVSSMPADLGVVQMIASDHTSAIALRTDGTLRAWGSGYSPFLSVPAITMPVGRVVLALGAGAFAVGTDGLVTAWSEGSQSIKRSLGAPNLRHVVAARQSSWPSGTAGPSAVFVGLVRDHAPAFTRDLGDRIKRTGDRLELSVEVAGAPVPALQWFKDGSPIAGATSTRLVVAAVSPSDAGSYWVEAVNSLGAATSATAAVTILSAPQVTPISGATTVPPGQPATLNVTATGSTPLSYQWYHDGREIAGATGDDHSIPVVNKSTTGVYAVRVTDGAGVSRVALARVAMPGAMLRWTDGAELPAIHASGHVPVAFSEGEPQAALGAEGEYLSLRSGGGSLVAPPAAELPPGIGKIVTIARTAEKALVLLADGTVLAWTESDFPSYPSYGPTRTPLAWRWQGAALVSERNERMPVPGDLGDVIAVSLGATEALALRSDGTVAAWTFATGTPASSPPGLAGVVAISSGSGHHLALKSDGNVVAWGSNINGQTNVPAALSGVVQIVADGTMSLALKSDGTIIQWGGLPTTNTVWTPEPPPAGPFERIGESGLAIRPTGDPVQWPKPQWHQNSSLEPLPPALGEIWDIRRFQNYTGFGQPTYSLYPYVALYSTAPPSILEQPVSRAVMAGENASLTVLATARPRPAFQWFKDGAAITNAKSAEYKITGFQSANAGTYTVTVSNEHGTVTSAPAVLSVASGPAITAQPQSLALHPGAGGTLTVTASGTGTLAYEWFKNGSSIAGATSSSLALSSDALASAGLYQVRITDDNGTQISRMVRVGEGCSVTAWRAGEVHALHQDFSFPRADVFLGLSDGEAWLALAANGNMGWLYRVESFSTFGGFHPMPLSFPGQGSYSLPPPADSSFVSAATRGVMGIALAGNGRVTAWESSTSYTCYGPAMVGANFYNCFPSGSSRQLLVPGSAHGAVAVSMRGDEEALALQPDGRVIAWDARWSVLRIVPAAAMSGVIAISSGGDHHLALKADGSVIAWGDNTEGECDVPAGLASAVAVSAIKNTSFAIHGDGSVTAWGSNENGQATPPAGLSGVISIRGAEGMVLAVKADGSVVSWGAQESATLLPPGLAGLRAVGVLPVMRPLSPGTTPHGSDPGGSYGVGLAPALPPTVYGQPLPRRVFSGFSGYLFDSSVGGFPGGPYTARWQRNGADLAGAGTLNGASASLSLTNVTASDAGNYRVAFASAWGETFSQEAALEVVQPRLFASWRVAHFTPEEIAAGLDAPGADPGGLGAPNLLRYAFGLDPRRPALSALPVAIFAPAQPPAPGELPLANSLGTLTLAFSVPNDTADLRFRLESSPDLLTWTTAASQPVLGSTTNGRRQASFSTTITSVTVPPGAPPHRFFRIAVELVAPDAAPQF